MGIKPIVQTNTTTVNTDTLESREKIVQDYYHFFDYKNKEAWGENKDLYEKYLYEAESSDYYSYGNKAQADGYLSKKEYNLFLTKLKTHNNIKFSEAEISEEEKLIIKEYELYPESWHKSEAITNKDKKIRKNIFNVATVSTFAGLAGAALTSIGLANCENLQKGNKIKLETVLSKTKVGKFTGKSAIGTVIAIGLTLTSCAVGYIHRKIVDKKISQTEQN